MPIKDPEKSREYHREYMRKFRKEKNPNAKHHGSYYDLETHRELAMNSGIQSQPEWCECHKRGFMPDGIYFTPDREFRRK